MSIYRFLKVRRSPWLSSPFSAVCFLYLEFTGLNSGVVTIKIIVIASVVIRIKVM